MALEDARRAFADREDAGRRLAAALSSVGGDALVLGIPRGGVVVAAVIARELGVELDVILARKLGAPRNPELAIGAIGPDGAPLLDEFVLAQLGGLPHGYIEAETRRQTDELRRRLRRYRGDAPPPRVQGRTCVVVDDGLATGSTARACLAWLRRSGASPTVLAVPVAPPQAVQRLREDADAVVSLLTPDYFVAVGRWYDRFDEVSDEEVVELLKEERHADDRA